MPTRPSGAAASSLTFSGNSTLQAGAAGITLSASRVLAISNGVTATLDTNGNQLTVAGPIGNSGSLVEVGAGLLLLTGSNTYAGATIISAGTLQAQALPSPAVGGTLSPNSPITLSQGATLNLTGSAQTLFSLSDGSGGGLLTNSGTSDNTVTIDAGTFSGQIANGPTNKISLVKATSGTLVLNGANTYTGATTLSGGTLNLNGSLAGTAISVSNAAFSEGGSGVISGSAGFALASGQAILAGANTYTGATTLSGGTLNLNGSLAGTAISVFNATFSEGGSGVISGSTGFTLTSGQATLSGANTYSGTTAISGGVLQLGNGSAAQNSTVNVNVNSGLAFSAGAGGAFNIGALAGAGNFTLQDTSGGAVALTAGGNGASTTYSGAISGSGSLVKTGTGKLALSNYSTFSGGTIVNGGTLQLNVGGNIGTLDPAHRSPSMPAGCSTSIRPTPWATTATPNQPSI